MGQIISQVLEKQRKRKLLGKRSSALMQDPDTWPIAGGSEVKLVVMGSGGVGKSSITLQFVHNCFPDEYDPTIEDNFRKQTVVDDWCQMLDILDTAGQEEFACMKDQWVRNGEGFLLVYGVDDRQSFDDISDHAEFIRKVKEARKGPIMLVGNKCDLPPEERQVSTQEGQDLANLLGIGKFMETSAKKRINIDEAFAELVREVRKYCPPPSSK